MASWAAVLGEEGISHLLNELIRAQRFHFEEAAGLSLISVALDLRRSGGEGAISNTCSPGDFTAGKWLGLTSLPAQATAPLSRAELKMNGANCSSSCHISRAETKPLLTQETMSLCKSQRPTETSPQPRTMQRARVHPALPTSHCHGTPGRPWDSLPLAAAHLPGQLWVSQPCQVPSVTLAAPWAIMDPPAIALPAMAPRVMAVVLPHLSSCGSWVGLSHFQPAVAPEKDGAAHPAWEWLSGGHRASHRRLPGTTARKMKSAINYSLTKETRRGKKGRRKACEEGILNTN